MFVTVNVLCICNFVTWVSSFTVIAALQITVNQDDTVLLYLLQSPYCLILGPYRTINFIGLCNLYHFHNEKFLKGACY